MSEWQPIDTAPKDGTRILTYCPDAPKYHKQPVRINLWKENTWWTSNEAFWPPTHWMLLPDLPK